MDMTKEQKEKMIQRRLEEYAAKLFALEMDKTALEAIGDTEGVTNTVQRMESLRKAYEAVKGMM